MKILQKASRVAKLPTGIRSGKFSIQPNYRFDTDYYEIKLGGNVIGSANLQTTSAASGLLENFRNFFPKDWFQSSPNGELKPCLNITHIEIFKDKGKGFGRKAMQLLYKLSRKRGCGGRITLVSTQNAAGFYSHLGFDGIASEEAKYRKIYAQCLEYARNTHLDNVAFLRLLKKCGCPTLTKGKFDTAGVRIFNPTKSNIEMLFG